MSCPSLGTSHISIFQGCLWHSPVTDAMLRLPPCRQQKWLCWSQLPAFPRAMLMMRCPSASSSFENLYVFWPSLAQACEKYTLVVDTSKESTDETLRLQLQLLLVSVRLLRWQGLYNPLEGNLCIYIYIWYISCIYMYILPIGLLYTTNSTTLYKNQKNPLTLWWMCMNCMFWLYLHNAVMHKYSRICHDS